MCEKLLVPSHENQAEVMAAKDTYLQDVYPCPFPRINLSRITGQHLAFLYSLLPLSGNKNALETAAVTCRKPIQVPAHSVIQGRVKGQCALCHDVCTAALGQESERISVALSAAWGHTLTTVGSYLVCSPPPADSVHCFPAPASPGSTALLPIAGTGYELTATTLESMPAAKTSETPSLFLLTLDFTKKEVARYTGQSITHAVSVKTEKKFVS
ncbi:hypothetical protein Anapl_05570 [Anas platyrhynchos]|uniref:Uncharacterized protein n=1 Tax=Anas platyrhynchos TaxID=8839 RepID=R0LRR0_ANAPL|nr:hypothetical protein Anapl_05570 [Anas platyrhynchos]